MEHGGMDVAWFVVYTGQGELSKEGYKKAAINATEKFDAIKRLVSEYAPEKISLATNSNQVDSIMKMGKKVAMIGVENAYPIGENLHEIKRYAKLGARYMSLAHNGHNQFSDSNTGEFDNSSKHNGISELGKKAIDSMNYYGIIVDISHPSKEAIRQTIIHSKAPVIASHSSARTLSYHPRNLDDEQLELIKNNGGVIQTTALGSFLTDRKDPPPKLLLEPNLAACFCTFEACRSSLACNHFDPVTTRHLTISTMALQLKRLKLNTLLAIEGEGMRAFQCLRISF